jgi:hypothetical protein
VRTPNPTLLCKLLIVFVQIFEFYFINYLEIYFSLLRLQGKHLHRDSDWIVAKIRVPSAWADGCSVV